MVLGEYKLFMREFYHAHEDIIPKQIKIEMNEVVDRVLKYKPYKSEKLDYALRGLRSYHIPNSEYRIIFAICEECRKDGNQSLNGCQDCDNIPSQSIILFTCGPHFIYEWLGRKLSQVQQAPQ